MVWEYTEICNDSSDLFSIAWMQGILVRAVFDLTSDEARMDHLDKRGGDRKLTTIVNA